MNQPWPRPAASDVEPEPATSAALADAASSDAALVERARRGDRAAFDALHQKHARAVHGLLLAHVAPHDADDLLQEVFLTAWRRLETLRELESFVPWLLAIARHAAFGAGRRARDGGRTAASLAAGLGLGSEPASRPLDATADGTEILRLMVELPEAYRETLALRLIEGLSGQEIADATGLTHGSVRVNLHRGMQLLRERLRQEGYA